MINAQAEGPWTANSIMDVNTAKEKVKKFIDTPNATLSYKKDINLPYLKGYELESDDGIFIVNKLSGDVEGAYFKNKMARLSNITIKLDDAKAKAEKFAEKHYTGFSSINMKLRKADILDHGDAGKEYIFSWQEEINWIYTPNYVCITIDPSTGDLTSYIGITRPVNINLDSKISEDKAITIASAQFDNISVARADATLNVIYTSDEKQKVAWIVDVLGEPKDDITQGGSVTIDAMTGEVAEINEYK